MKTIYLLLARTKTPLSLMVRGFTGDRYTHVSLGLDRELTHLYSFARRKRYLPIIAGFVSERLDEGIYGQNPNAPCALMALPVEDSVYEAVCEQILGYYRAYGRYKYNFLGLLLIRLGIPLPRKHHLVCSQFVARVLSQSGACTLPKRASLMRPMDYYRLPGWQVAYEGRLHGCVDPSGEANSNAAGLQPAFQR